MSKHSTKDGLNFVFAKVREACDNLGFNDYASRARATAALQDARSRIVNYYDIDVDTTLFNFNELLVAASYAEVQDYDLARKHALIVLGQLRKSEAEGLL